MRTIESESISIQDIKEDISLAIGKTIIINEYNKQGKVLHEYVGEILSVYNNLFLVKVETNRFSINKSFSFVDFITKELKYEIKN